MFFFTQKYEKMPETKNHTHIQEFLLYNINSKWRYKNHPCWGCLQRHSRTNLVKDVGTVSTPTDTKHISHK
jgi:hypothetical protein